MLEARTYCPILHARLAEMNALFHLPPASKNEIFPLFVARPWPNAKKLERTWKKISEAFGERPFALDLDRTRFRYPSAREAAAEFDALFDPADGYANYYRAVQDLSGAVPTLRLGYGAIDQVDDQLARVDNIDRGFAVRVEYGFTQNPIAILNELFEREREFVLFVDLGWSRELHLREAWATQILERVVGADFHPELVVCGSSFPDDFTDIRLRGRVAVIERVLHDSVVRRFNALTIKYGDWASTRPPTEPTPMNPVWRIDLPLLREWVCFRQSEEEEYDDIARRVTSDRAWPRSLNIWGINSIEWTAEGLPGAIRSPVAAAQARINIHMHLQANYDAPQPSGDVDEPYTDE